MYRASRHCISILSNLVAIAVGLFMISTAAIYATSSIAAEGESLDLSKLGRIDELVKKAIRDGMLPGAVVLVGQHGRIHYRKAFGNRALVPKIEPMTADTVFDLGSLTKVVATTPSVMLSVEQGRIRLDAPVSDYIQDFDRNGKTDITLRHLLTHMSGLKPGLDLANPWQGYDKAIALAANEVPLAKPGERVIYSDVNFLLSGEIVRLVSGMSLDQFAFTHLYGPLGMFDTGFNPPGELGGRIAPTSRCEGHFMICRNGAIIRGLVHDPTARRMGGVAGHVGLFSTADDLSVFCQMLLNDGAYGKRRILSPLTVKAMTAPWTPPDEPNVRGLGWDLEVKDVTDGDTFKNLRPFGHTGFTGTLLWLDPASGLYVVFLSNRLHPDGRGDVTDLRAEVVNIAVSALANKSTLSFRSKENYPSNFLIGQSPQETLLKRRPLVLTGVDVLQAEDFSRLQGKRVALLTNQTGRARDGSRTIDLLHKARNVELVSLFSPEHGIRAKVEGPVPSSRDEDTGLPIHSLYGKHRRPTAKMLAGIDIIVVDL
jgi:CubicO group peptidase (beta-lactamase class C family)